MRRERYVPDCRIELTYTGKVNKRFIPCLIGDDITFDAEGLQSYFFRANDTRIYDCLLLAAAVDFCDHSKSRPKLDWARRFHVRMPVHDLGLWADAKTKTALTETLNLLTGDIWEFIFFEAPSRQSPFSQTPLELGMRTEVVVPFSDGLDSRAVSAILAHDLGDRLVRVRLSTRKLNDAPRQKGSHVPFAAVPFRVKKRHAESSGRSRGFKFAMISGLAGYLVDAKSVVVSESGQGSIGPAIINVGHIHPDYRTHPRFTQKMADFLECVLGIRPNFDHQSIWNTKGETVRRYIGLNPSDVSWRDTRSCWQSPQQMSVEGRHRQCGVCAACMLRRMSLHAAGLEEQEGVYVWDNLSAGNFWDGAHKDLKYHHGAFKEYALAGTLHLDHLAKLSDAPQYEAVLGRQSFLLSRSLGLPMDETYSRLKRLLREHAVEWESFVGSLSRSSFVRGWIGDND